MEKELSGGLRPPEPPRLTKTKPQKEDTPSDIGRGAGTGYSEYNIYASAVSAVG